MNVDTQSRIRLAPYKASTSKGSAGSDKYFDGSVSSRPDSATICVNALHLPIHPTLTLSLAPICAIHSLKAETPISREMVIDAGSATSNRLSWCPADRTTSVVATISLSATGSKNAPKAEEIFHRLARYPSA
eukprot:CAMPEP_0173388978 /NCGR_PEP_ID=MMETSP1356-20130122/11159_1 /TAXON_ID=77927 ORGANISM="Hemiselmis virescens, Strain PCC157" /NCGR_SAMPLE_ID=MMETSP1356 /ASSEMBLY_ACC=CAM_ASM_000847 /LENGTH=131 /DNA_ID=CAMNT_0014346003 /DNA_START=217 /DNA_END=612 /DNA_ORIENTATION=-